jgi:Small-conductance mechanosensitive channel
MVEQINLRTIVVRDGEGAVQVFPNGTITALANLSKQFAYAVVDVRIAYSENMDRVMGTIARSAPRWSATRIGARSSWRRSTSSASNRSPMAWRPIRVKFKTQPLNQGKIASELRRRLMTTFVARGIKPFAQ